MVAIANAQILEELTLLIDGPLIEFLLLISANVIPAADLQWLRFPGASRGRGPPPCAAETVVIAFRAASGAFEFVVADAGIGILRRLPGSPEFLVLVYHGRAIETSVDGWCVSATW